MFVPEDLQKSWKNTVKIEKGLCRLAPAMRISNRNLDARDKYAVNTTNCLQSPRKKRERFPRGRKPRRSLVLGKLHIMERSWGYVVFGKNLGKKTKMPAVEHHLP